MHVAEWLHLGIGKGHARSYVPDSVPTLYEVYGDVHGKKPAGEWDLYKAVALDISRLVRTWLLSPGPPHTGAIRQAMDRMAKDPAFVSDWERTFGNELAPIRFPVKIAEVLKNNFLRPAPWQGFLRKFVQQ